MSWCICGKKISHTLWLDMIFVQLVLCFLSYAYPLAKACGQKTHNSLDKNHIQPQTMGYPICIYINKFIARFSFYFLVAILDRSN
jgi:hypothetical protein